MECQEPLTKLSSPTAISASSLPIGGASLTQPVSAWLNAIDWLKANVPSNNVVVSWWDYGFWLTYLGNVTTLNDNTTENTTQIENVGFTIHGQRKPINADAKHLQ